MIKKTQQHRKYGQLAEQLLLKLVNLANKVFASLLQLLVALKMLYIVNFRLKSGVISILSLLYGKLKRVAIG